MTTGTDTKQTTLTESEWLALELAHHDRMSEWLEPELKRHTLHDYHPIHDFLFTYYSFRPALMKRWNPQGGVSLKGAVAKRFLKDRRYAEDESGVFLDRAKLSKKEMDRIKWIYDLLKKAEVRPPQFNCFGLHEWAMVYKSENVRHESLPLRMSMDEITKVVDSQTICCSHYDAFRFFTKAAEPLNTIKPEHETRDKFEQFGCLHFNMDLYKWCYKLIPMVSSDLMADCFFLALDARIVDMRASPYDVSQYGYAPICIETEAGRLEYVKEQSRILEKSKPLRERMFEECEWLLKG